jgi:hypothetical protein
MGPSRTLANKQDSPKLLSDYGAQRAHWLRPWCIGTVRARTQIIIKQLNVKTCVIRGTKFLFRVVTCPSPRIRTVYRVATVCMSRLSLNLCWPRFRFSAVKRLKPPATDSPNLRHLIFRHHIFSGLEYEVLRVFFTLRKARKHIFFSNKKCWSAYLKHIGISKLAGL